MNTTSSPQPISTDAMTQSEALKRVAASLARVLDDVRAGKAVSELLIAEGLQSLAAVDMTVPDANQHLSLLTVLGNEMQRWGAFFADAVEGKKEYARSQGHEGALWNEADKHLGEIRAALLPFATGLHDRSQLPEALPVEDPDRMVLECVKTIAAVPGALHHQTLVLYCAQCGVNLDDGESHKPDCLCIRAQHLLTTAIDNMPLALHQSAIANQAFETWAKTHGGIDLSKSEDMTNERRSLYPATYQSAETEIAWRAVANTKTSSWAELARGGLHREGADTM